MRRSIMAALCCALLATCDGEVTTDAAPAVVHTTVGDTVVVRTERGSVWTAQARLEPEVSIGELDGAEEYLFGSIRSITVDEDHNVYVLDRQAGEVRVYDAEGVHVRTLGRQGQGPGELSRPEAMAFLSDGRVAVRDPANSRIQVFSADGTGAEEWPVIVPGRGGGEPLWVDDDDNLYAISRSPESDGMDFATVVFVVGPDGAVRDTLPPPGAWYEPPVLDVTSPDGRGRGIWNIPYAPNKYWAFHPDGHPVLAISTEYRIRMQRTEAAPLWIEKAYDAIPIDSDERSVAEARIVRGVRNMAPGYTWDGPPIPADKPPFRAIYAARDGRIWVLYSVPSVEEDNPSFDPAVAGSEPTRWREPFALEVFESDGTYLGSVEVPDNLRLNPVPFFSGDHVWSVTTDELGVQRVVRWRLVIP